MFRRFLLLCICAAMVLASVPACAAAAGTAEFYNSENEKISEITDEQTVYAKVNFTAPGSEATVITARYGSDGALQDARTEKLTGLTKGENVDYTTKSIGVSGTDTVKVFAVDRMDSLVPLLDSGASVSRDSAINVSVSADAVAVNNVVSEKISLHSGVVSATISEGTLLADGADKIVLTVTELESSQSGIIVKENESIIPVDVHIEGIAENNTVPVIVTIESIAMTGINKGNLTLYHVENGKNVAMVQVDSVAELTAHNQFCYDALTGTITLAMATFSEVAVVADTENAWNGGIATAFAGGTGTEDNPYIIANADQLVYMGDRVSNDNPNYGSAYYKLTSDINFGGIANYEENGRNVLFYPIGYNMVGGSTDDKGNWYTYGGSFKGVFDGAGHTISNIYQNTWVMVGDYDGMYYNDAMGLFGYVNGGTVKNLTIDNFYSEGEFAPTGCITAYAAGKATFENIAVTNSHPQTYNTGVAGIVGWDNGGDTESDASSFTFKNITIDSTNTISALWGSWDVAAAGLLGYLGKYSSAELERCNVSATIDVYNDVCGNYQYYWYRYCGMMIGTVDRRKADGSLDLNGITATECTADFGDRHEYYYCEFEKNTQASYTEDYQFSRVDHSDLNMDESPVTCNHDHTVNEDKQAVYLPFRQLFGGYGWGVDGVDLEEYTDENGDKIIDINTAETKEKFSSKFTNDYLYRVGNKNTVSLGSLFEAVDENAINDSGVYVTVDKVDDSIDVGGTFTKSTTGDWTSGTIKFTGTGPVKVTIQDYNYCKPTTIYLEVVDAYNVTTASFSGNSVLLNDVSASSSISTSGVIYGNGFTVNMENAPISEKNGAVFHLYDGAVLKNVKIVGKEFTSVAMNVNDTNYGVSAVRAWGKVTIENSYISGCRSAVSVTGTELTIKDSVIANGVYANIDFRSGVLNLHNVTTVNEPHTVDGTTIVGLGIVGNMTASAGRQLNITGSLTQYNWVSEEDCKSIKASGADNIFNSVFTDDKYESLRYTYNGTTYVNTGILSLCNDFGASAVSGLLTDYSGMDVSATISGVSVDGYVWAPAKQGTLTDSDMEYHDKTFEWIPNNQGTSFIAPDFDFTDTGLEVKSGVVQVSYESGDSYTLTATTIGKILDSTKYGKALAYNVLLDGTDYTGKDIVLDGTASKTYTVTYNIVDALVYDKFGSLTEITYTVSKDLNVFATVVDKSADMPNFTFYYGTNGSASGDTPHTTRPTNSYSSIIEKIGEAYYIMPNAGATEDDAIGSQTVDGITVYYPIVDGINVRSGNTADYDFTRYYPVFKAVDISDNGTIYNYETTEMPDTVIWVEATIDSGNGASALKDGYSLYNDTYLCRVQNKAGDAESGGTSIVKYSYTALDGNTYYYYVGYRFYDEKENNVCVTPDTLVTLADGSQKEIRDISVGEAVVAWNFHTGKYETVPVLLCQTDGSGEMDVLHLYFDDGTILKVLGEHGIFDANLNNFIFIDKDDVKEYIGHSFVQKFANSYKTVKLIDYKVTSEDTQAYTILSSEHHNVILEGMFTLTPAHIGGNFFNPFTIGEKMKYDESSVKADIEKYGLYTYEDFSHVLTYEQFKALNIAPFKVAVGKGIVTYEGLIFLIENFINR